MICWKVLVTGSRDWPDDAQGRGRIRDALRWTQAAVALPCVLVHGDARGADRIAAGLAKEMGWEVRPYAVDKALDGAWPGAGPKRNQRMLDAENKRDEPIDAAYAFPMPDARGTWDMVRRLSVAGIRARIVHLEEL